MVKYSLGHEVSSEHGCSTMEKQPPGVHCSRMRHVGSWILSDFVFLVGLLLCRDLPWGLAFPPYLSVLLVTLIHMCCSPATAMGLRRLWKEGVTVLVTN